MPTPRSQRYRLHVAPRLAAPVVVACLALGATAIASSHSTWTVCSDAACDFATIGAAVTAATAGDVLLLGAELFIESVVVDRDLTLRGLGAGATRLTTGGGTVVTIDSGVSATIRELAITGGFTVGAGGGIRNSGTLVVVDALIEDNLAIGNGGGIWTEGSLTLDAVTLQSNGAEAAGGGLYVTRTALSDVVHVRRSLIAENIASEGGGIYANGTVTIVNTAVTNNNARDAAMPNRGLGGGVNNHGAIDVRSSTIGGNTSADKGGGLSNSGDAVLTNTTVSGNVASANFGGANQAGGGVFNAITGDLVLNNVTITDNDGNGSGVGIFNDGTPFTSGVVTLRNSIVALQRAGGDDCGGDFNPVYNSAGWNIDSDNSCSLQAANADWPNASALAIAVEPLADYGGPTATHNLESLSIAVDAGDPAGCLADLDFDGVAETAVGVDQRGQPRVDSPSQAGGPCDIGAVEHNLVLNAMMDDDKDGDRRADRWITLNIQNYDRRVCKPALAHSGRCATRMKGRNNRRKSFFQTVDHVGFLGNVYEAVVHVATRNAPAGSLDMVVAFEDAVGNTARLTTPITTGTHGYQAFTMSVAAPIGHTRVTVGVESTMTATGRLVIDDASLVR